MSAGIVVAASGITLVDGLSAAPIPQEWVRGGDPQARVKSLSESSDGLFRMALWDCTAGSFEWQFADDETVHILEGEVVVTCPSGAQRRLGAGDVAYFPAGISSLWTVPVYVRKLAVLRGRRRRLTPVRLARAVARRLVRRNPAAPQGL